MGKQAGRKLFSLAEIYGILYKGAFTAQYGRAAVKQGSISEAYKERLMLAVTEVNDCPMCSYFHAQQALESGMSQEEVQAILAGTMDAVPPEELPGVLFAQHYAETRGYPSREAFQGLVNQVGFEKARAILGLIRAIMMGNALGIPLGSLKNRFKGKPDSRSSLGYELSVCATLPVFLLAALLQAFFSRVLSRRADTPEKIIA